MRISVDEARDRIPQRDIILETTVRLMVPFIQLYGLYVIVHGHYSPGGGFQGGVILGASVILYALALGMPASQQYLSEGTDIIMANVGALIFVGIATICLCSAACSSITARSQKSCRSIRCPGVLTASSWSRSESA